MGTRPCMRISALSFVADAIFLHSRCPMESPSTGGLAEVWVLDIRSVKAQPTIFLSKTHHFSFFIICGTATSIMFDWLGFASPALGFIYTQTCALLLNLKTTLAELPCGCAWYVVIYWCWVWPWMVTVRLCCILFFCAYFVLIHTGALREDFIFQWMGGILCKSFTMLKLFLLLYYV